MTAQPSDGCQHCGAASREHFQRWTTEAGWHKWTAPTAEQVRARFLAQHANR